MWLSNSLLNFQKFSRLPKFPSLRNLKQLELFLNVNGARDLLCLMSLLNASPLLHLFELRVNILPLNLISCRQKCSGYRLNLCLHFYYLSPLKFLHISSCCCS